jgi:hypothetical protein
VLDVSLCLDTLLTAGHIAVRMILDRSPLILLVLGEEVVEHSVMAISLLYLINLNITLELLICVLPWSFEIKVVRWLVGGFRVKLREVEGLGVVETLDKIRCQPIVG